jgi:hypothetical protein
MKNTIVFILLITLLGGCNKDRSLDHTEVKGRLLDASTGEPIEGGSVYLTWGVSSTILDSLTTGADGRYSFIYDHDSIPVADVYAQATNYLTNRNIGTWAAQYPNGGASGRIGVRQNGQVNHEDIRLPPMGYVNYHFKQVQPFSGTIQIRFTPYDNPGVVSWNGQGLDRTYTSVFPGGVDYRLVYSILRNGQVDVAMRDTMFIPRFDTLTLYVEF